MENLHDFMDTHICINSTTALIASVVFAFALRYYFAHKATLYYPTALFACILSATKAIGSIVSVGLCVYFYQSSAEIETLINWLSSVKEVFGRITYLEIATLLVLLWGKLDAQAEKNSTKTNMNK